MIRILDNRFFVLSTRSTTYAFGILPTGQLEHLHYGAYFSLPEEDEKAIAALAGLTQKQAFGAGNVIAYTPEHWAYSMEDVRLEVSGYGKGDIREPFAELLFEDGSTTVDLVYESALVTDEKPEFATLPGSYSEDGKVEHLAVTFRECNSGTHLVAHYYVYPECDVITRSAELINNSDKTVIIKRLMSTQVDFDDYGYVMTSFHGAWAREMQRDDVLISSGKHVVSSFTGTSSSRANPFVMLYPSGTSETAGACYGFNLIYSGNHYEAAEVNAFGKTRFVAGINPTDFAYKLEPGASFEAPEAVMTYSGNGFDGMSTNMHAFVREHIVRGEWKHKTRPVLLNSWEAAYFDISESKLLKLAKAGAEAGIELFVMDDGWFGERNDDSSSLGDWDVNTTKLPGGLKRLADKVNAMGIDFGIWVEPEMVSVKSRLYEQHPDWAMAIPGKVHAEGRSQRLLDLNNPAVQDFVIEKMTEVFSSANIAYVKWDMNRIVSDVFSPYLPADRQGEALHGYVCGLYRCMKTLTERFPHILFEGCSAGGNRFDLGILSYFPQIWASDDTDALCRTYVQTGYSYGYPMSTVTAHVSACPNHQTLRTTPLETRFNVAAFGVLGYECNFCDLKSEEFAAVKAQIELYKEWREVLQWGEFHRGRTLGALPVAGANLSGIGPVRNDSGNLAEWTVVSPDGKRAVGFLFQELVVPNSTHHVFRPAGLRDDKLYHFYNRTLKIDVREFGDLVNTVSPIHLKQDSLMLDLVAKFVKMDGETEDLVGYGNQLKQGIRLRQSFGATGYSGEVRHFQDFASRIYFFEVIC